MYLQIMEQIRARIAAGDWAPGKELPSIRALAAGLNVSVITVKRAYLDLESEGVIVTRHGKGSFVADVNGLAGELKEEQLEEHLDRGRRDRPACSASRPTNSRSVCAAYTATWTRNNERQAHRNARRPQGLPLLHARRPFAGPRARADHGLRRTERRRQEHHAATGHGNDLARCRRDSRAGPRDTRAPGRAKRDVGYVSGGDAPAAARHARAGTWNS